MPVPALAREPLDADQEWAFYAIGLRIGRNYTGAGLREAELERVKAGMTDQVLGREIRVNDRALVPRIDRFLSQRELGEEAEQEVALLYAIGVRMGRAFWGLGLSESEFQIVKAGMTDQVLDRGPSVDHRSLQKQIAELHQQRRAGVLAAEKAASAAFLERAAAADGTARTPSGLLFTQLRPGTGPFPEPDDIVTIHYHGRLRDGTVFASSVEEGVPEQFRLKDGMPCWSEGIRRIRIGGKARIWCPAETTHGDRETKYVPAGAALGYEIELLSARR